MLAGWKVATHAGPVWLLTMFGERLGNHTIMYGHCNPPFSLVVALAIINPPDYSVWLLAVHHSAGQRAPSTPKSAAALPSITSCPTLNTGYLPHPLQRFGIPKSHAYSSGITAHVCSLCLACTEAAALGHYICFHALSVTWQVCGSLSQHSNQRVRSWPGIQHLIPSDLSAGASVHVQLCIARLGPIWVLDMSTPMGHC